MIIFAVLALSACNPTHPSTSDASSKTAPAPSAGVTTTVSGPARTITPRGSEERADDVSVARVAPVGESGAKLFSTVGGDPAINGEYLFLAVPSDDAPMEDPKVYKLGDFNSWSLESQSAGQLVIRVSRSWIDEAGDIKTAQERYVVAVPAWSAGATTITPVE